jgi:tetratricopeptide (TPR) repeat protein
LSNPEWVLTGMHPATAVLHWARSPQPEVREYVTSHPYSVMELAFRKPEPTSDRPRERALPPTWSQQLFALPRRQPSGPTLLARHWLRLATAGQGAPLPFGMACVTLATRAAQAGVEATPDVPAAHAMLAEAYSLMLQVESASLANTGVTWNISLRYFQAVAAAREAIRLDPDDTVNHLLLLELYRGANRIDAAYGLTQDLVEHTQLADDFDEAELRRREELLRIDDELGKATRQLQEMADKQLADGGDRLQVATALYQDGAIQHAAKLLQDDAVYVERTPSARLLLTMLLAELGAGVELDDSAVRLEAVGSADNLPRWRDAAAIAALSRGDFTVASQHWHREVNTRDRDGVQGLLYTAALNTSSFVWLGDLGYPISHLGLAGEATVRRPQEQLLGEFNQAVCELERAHTTEATAALRRALDSAPTSPLRPLLRTYWYCLTGEALDLEPPTDWIPISADMFAAEK